MAFEPSNLIHNMPSLVINANPLQKHIDEWKSNATVFIITAYCQGVLKIGDLIESSGDVLALAEVKDGKQTEVYCAYLFSIGENAARRDKYGIVKFSPSSSVRHYNPQFHHPSEIKRWNQGWVFSMKYAWESGFLQSGSTFQNCRSGKAHTVEWVAFHSSEQKICVHTKDAYVFETDVRAWPIANYSPDTNAKSYGWNDRYPCPHCYDVVRGETGIVRHQNKPGKPLATECEEVTVSDQKGGAKKAFIKRLEVTRPAMPELDHIVEGIVQRNNLIPEEGLPIESVLEDSIRRQTEEREVRKQERCVECTTLAINNRGLRIQHYISVMRKALPARDFLEFMAYTGLDQPFHVREDTSEFKQGFSEGIETVSMNLAEHAGYLFSKGQDDGYDGAFAFREAHKYVEERHVKRFHSMNP